MISIEVFGLDEKHTAKVERFARRYVRGRFPDEGALYVHCTPYPALVWGRMYAVHVKYARGNVIEKSDALESNLVYAAKVALRALEKQMHGKVAVDTDPHYAYELP